MSENLGKLLGKTIEGLVDQSDERYERREIQLTLSDGTEVLIVNPQSVEVRAATRCPRCGSELSEAP